MSFEFYLSVASDVFCYSIFCRSTEKFFFRAENKTVLSPGEKFNFGTFRSELFNFRSIFRVASVARLRLIFVARFRLLIERIFWITSMSLCTFDIRSSKANKSCLFLRLTFE